MPNIQKFFVWKFFSELNDLEKSIFISSFEYSESFRSCNNEFSGTVSTFVMLL